MRFRNAALIVFLFLLMSLAVNGQRLFPIYSQYMLNGLALNPAYVGSKEALSVTLSHRSQWVGLEGAPVIQSLSAHAPMKNNSTALGLFLFNESIDVRNNMGIYGNYGFRIPMGQGKFTFGLKAGMDIQRADWSKISTVDQPDPVFTDNVRNSVVPNFGFGLYYTTDDYYAGISIPAFFNDSLKNGRTQIYHDFADYNYLFTAGFVFGPQVLKFKPSFLLKYNRRNPVQADFNMSAMYNNLFWLGVSYRMKDAIVALVKVEITEQFSLGYTYDFSLGMLNKFHNGSHEIVLIYDFLYRVKGSNPRYF